MKILEKSEERGGYALGSGNSIAAYVPLKNYFTMLKTVNTDLKLQNFNKKDCVEPIEGSTQSHLAEKEGFEPSRRF